jgi:hypothetical protein
VVPEWELTAVTSVDGSARISSSAVRAGTVHGAQAATPRSARRRARGTVLAADVEDSSGGLSASLKRCLFFLHLSSPYCATTRVRDTAQAVAMSVSGGWTMSARATPRMYVYVAVRVGGRGALEDVPYNST